MILSHGRRNPLVGLLSRHTRSLATTLPSQPSQPHSADVVVIGGGIIGTSVAYHLAVTQNIPNVVLLEQDQLTSGTTWHAAGLMNAFGSLSRTSTWMRLYTQDLYKNILLDNTGWQEIGLLTLACTQDRLEYYRRIAQVNQTLMGVPACIEEWTPLQIQAELSHSSNNAGECLIRTEDVLAGFHVPTDGRANPTDATQALAKAAKKTGNVQIFEHTPVDYVETAPSTSTSGLRKPFVTGVRLRNGHVIATEKVVNCTGMWARQLAQQQGQNMNSVPNQAAEHYYFITEPMSHVDPNGPVIEDPDRCVYIRPESGGLLLGLFESHGAQAWPQEKCRRHDVPDDFAFGEISPDMERILPFLQSAILERIPSVQNVGIKRFFCGPESFTPDGSPMVGESHEIQNYFVAAGMNSLGILTGGGIGHIMASWVKNGHPPDETVDVTGIQADRFHAYQSNPAYRKARVGEILSETYKIHYPFHQLQTCRNAKQSPLYDRCARANAFFATTSGWEAPLFYGSGTNNGTFAQPDWFPYWEREHVGCRTAVALFDMSFMSKFLVQGRDAGAFLNRLSTANVVGEATSPRITYTQWLNDRGYMQADVTVTQLQDETTFLVVATDTMHNQVYNHMRRHVKENEFVTVTDVTGRYAQINVQGPRSRELMQSVSSSPLLETMKFRDVQEIDIHLARVWCARITYVGELGYELFVPVEQAHLVYDALVKEGSRFDMVHAGLAALGSLRLEKGYRDYGHDMDNTDTLLECGLGFTCDFEKDVPFVGQERVMEQLDERKARGGLQKRMANLLLEDTDASSSPPHMLQHGEVVWRNGVPISEVRAASFGHSLGASVALTMLESTNAPINKAYLQQGEWEVGIATAKRPCRVSLAPFFDPKGTKIKM